jgi:5-methylcytosine-specific restriction enzyme A
LGGAGLLAHWILQCNPERYRLLDALRDGFDVRSWTVSRYLREIASGDEVAMWISGTKAGVYALAEITSGAEQSADDPDPYWVDPVEVDEVSWHVGICLGPTLPDPIPRSVLAADSDFADAAIIRMPGGGNPFPVTSPQWRAITSRIPTPTRRRTRSLNPAWATDELILALDLYLRQRGRIPSPRDPAIVALSDLLNRLPIHTVRPDLEKFRNANGVVLKITNFTALDPQYPGSGMNRGSRLDAVVWDRYASRPDELRRVADAIRSADETSLLPTVPEPDEEDIAADEGRLLTRLHRVRERDRQLVDRKKASVLAREGSLACEVCGFDFAATYGALGERFIEAHHIVPLAQAGATKTRLADLALVCSNCHRMLHRARPWMSPAKLQERVKSRKP